MNLRRIVAAITAVSTLPLALVSIPAQADEARAGGALPDGAAQQVEWGPCPIGAVADSAAQCATFEAPKDYAHPEGEKISLTMSKIPAKGQSRGVIAGNPGGPGGSALGMFRGDDNLPNTVKLPDSVREHYDLVAVQPRGLPWGTPLECMPPGMGELGLAEVSYELCEVQQPGYARTVNTENTARDLEEARKILGQDRLNLYGVSYGTVLMSTYATLFPQHTGKTMLDSSMNPDDVWFQLGASRKQGRIDALNAMFAWIAERNGEYGLGDTPLKVYKAWVARVNEHTGLSAAPLTPPPATEADIPAGSSVGELALSGVNLSEQVRWRLHRLLAPLESTKRLAEGEALGLAWILLVTDGALYNQNSWPRVAESLKQNAIVADPLEQNLIARVQGLDGEQQAEFAQGVSEQGKGTKHVDKAVTCNENRTPLDASRTIPALVETAAGDVIRANEDNIASGLHCAGWPEPTPLLWANGDALETKPLLVGYDHDSATTGEGNYAMQRAMGGELHVLPGYSHGVMIRNPEAVEEQVAAYFS
ncbi:alpha/beta fold hydrolase [Corynebacterium lowii]|uniref:Tripeptidyl aminopeptidase n=1 Tax=Corynebacterium lowii TaxID=1544413 RepID=A0A0Q0UE66_9CORY|nr:alpha/beta hydrolase [Corynebacterium lowii]KQB86126.1 Tripeptidyl aminopeptidase precursor [Corynebacterium lowii]MDP9852599.1 pimeloyl-ACP methyl ester carboxylesterase [Corynebacterium lowii]